MTDSTLRNNWSTYTYGFFACSTAVTWFSMAFTTKINFFAHTERNWITAFITLFAWLNWRATTRSSFMRAFFANPWFRWFTGDNNFYFFYTNTLGFKTYLAWRNNNFSTCAIIFGSQASLAWHNFYNFFTYTNWRKTYLTCGLLNNNSALAIIFFPETSITNGFWFTSTQFRRFSTVTNCKIAWFRTFSLCITKYFN